MSIHRAVPTAVGPKLRVRVPAASQRMQISKHDKSTLGSALSLGERRNQGRLPRGTVPGAESTTRVSNKENKGEEVFMRKQNDEKTQM